MYTLTAESTGDFLAGGTRARIADIVRAMFLYGILLRKLRVEDIHGNSINLDELIEE